MKGNIPEIISFCKKYKDIPYIENTFDIIKYLGNYNESLLNGLKSIIFYDSAIDDYYINFLEHTQVSFFEEKFNPDICPSIHLYLYEIFGCTINGIYKNNILSKIKALSDIVYYFLYGQYFLKHRLIVGIVIGHNNFYNLGLTDSEIELKANEIYNKYLNDNKIKISKKIYKTIYLYRIIKSQFKTKKWESNLVELNKTRSEYIKNKKENFEKKEGFFGSIIYFK